MAQRRKALHEGRIPTEVTCRDYGVMPHSLTCPRCKFTTVRRSRRRLLERVLPKLKPFRCDTCQKRFFRVAPAAAN